MKKAVCAIVTKGNLILGVTRKNDHNDWGLCGGKVEDDDPDVEYAVKRETLEETGIRLRNLHLLDSRVWGGYLQYCFTAEYDGQIEFNAQLEPHLVDWVSAQRLIDGSFGEYNREMFDKLGLI